MKRNYSPEIMDDFSIKDERIDDALKELEVINKYLGGVAASRSALKSFIRGNDQFTLLDAGSGAADILIDLQEKYNGMRIFTLDKNIRACRYAANVNREITVSCGDIFNIPFSKKKFEIIHLSLFLHHFKEEEIKEILKNLLPLVSKGIIINDLRRSVFAFAGITLLTRLFSRSGMVINDAPLSVKRGFVKKELVKILSALNVQYIIKRKWAFRWLVIINV